MAMIIKNAEVNGIVKDILLEKCLITKIDNNISGSNFYDAKGDALIPGLHDHHIHLNSTAVAINSVNCGPPDISNEIELIEKLNYPGHGWLRGIGYHHSVAGEIDRCWLDKNGPKRPIKIQHRSGRLWILNSAALKLIGNNKTPDGRLFDDDNSVRYGSEFPDLKPLMNTLYSYGITGVTEVTPSNGVKEYLNYIDKVKLLKIDIMGRSDLTFSESKYLKIHYHEPDLPSLERITQEIKSAHQHGKNIAAHCVTRSELMLVLAALEEAGPVEGDRIEHAAITDDFLINWIKKLNLIVVTQPNFMAERVDTYIKDVDDFEQENLWRLKSFINSGVRLAAGSDSPFGNSNPWFAMESAVNRPRGFENEALSPEEALSLYLKPPYNAGGASREIKEGATADLCLLNMPWSDARMNLNNIKPRATWIGGELVFNGVN
ncbi:MAG: amidohydrolase family protein [Hellea sp.]|jgi:predicted amidohydrolase YtcJ|nr:amidohydrolase family protein [Hellea sp.]